MVARRRAFSQPARTRRDGAPTCDCFAPATARLVRGQREKARRRDATPRRRSDGERRGLGRSGRLAETVGETVALTVAETVAETVALTVTVAETVAERPKACC